MNVLGFLATIIICGTAITIAWLLCKMGIKLNKTYQDNTVVVKPNTTTIKAETYPVETKTNQELEEELNKQQTSGMDVVIEAVNKLMGIQPVEEVKNEGK